MNYIAIYNTTMFPLQPKSKHRDKKKINLRMEIYASSLILINLFILLEGIGFLPAKIGTVLLVAAAVLVILEVTVIIKVKLSPIIFH